MEDILHSIGFGLACLWLCGVVPASGILGSIWAKDKLTKKPKFPDPTPKKAPGPTKERKPKKLCNEAEAITILGSRDRLLELVKQGKIRVFKDNGTILFSSVDVVNAIPSAKKRSKHSYPVISTFEEEHRITNPVEFGT